MLQLRIQREQFGYSSIARFVRGGPHLFVATVGIGIGDEAVNCA